MNPFHTTRITGCASILLACLLVAACGNSKGAWRGSGIKPSTVTALAGNAGDGAISIGWETPQSGDGPFSYRVQLTPDTNGIQTLQTSTGALILGLSNGTRYSVSITATNLEGEGPAATLQLTPAPLDTTAYTALGISGNNSGNASSGIFDPSLLRLDNGNVWMAYSSVSYYGNPQVKDVSTSLAYSSDGGATFNYARTLGNAIAATVTDSTGSVCGNTTCSGRWVYEVPFMVEDAGDPNASRRFKVFAHKYFLYPSGDVSTIYALGAIVMWTAAAPDGNWSAERSVLGWNLTPPELAPDNIVNTLDPALGECLTISEGSATLRSGELEFVFACSNGVSQKIVQLRSTDHADSFSYVGTLLEASDAAAFGASHFTAPALIASETSAQLLLVTPVAARSINGAPLPDIYAGCVAFPIANQQTAALFRRSGAPLAIAEISPLANQISGACTWEREIGNLGVLISSATVAPFDFGIIDTRKSF